MSIKRGKTIKGKHIGHKNNYMDNLLDKQWLRKRSLKRTTEALIMAAQEQAIRTNHKAMIKTQENS